MTIYFNFLLKVLSKKKKKKKESKTGLVVRKNVRKNIKWNLQTIAFWHQKKKKSICSCEGLGTNKIICCRTSVRPINSKIFKEKAIWSSEPKHTLNLMV